MSTAVDIDTDIDLSLLVGEMEDMECEHSEHSKRRDAHGNGPATHYVRKVHECSTPKVYAVCEKFSQAVTNNSLPMKAQCGHRGQIAEFLEVVGEIGSL